MEHHQKDENGQADRYLLNSVLHIWKYSIEIQKA